MPGQTAFHLAAAEGRHLCLEELLGQRAVPREALSSRSARLSSRLSCGPGLFKAQIGQPPVKIRYPTTKKGSLKWGVNSPTAIPLVLTTAMSVHFAGLRGEAEIGHRAFPGAVVPSQFSCVVFMVPCKRLGDGVADPREKVEVANSKFC